MKPNGIKTLWNAGKPVVNGWLSIACPFTAEIMAEQGYDALTVDLQHGLIGFDAATTMLQALRASGVTAMARVPWLDPSDVMKVIDAGAYGVICPMINNADDARRLVSYMRYPPHGVRSFGPTRAVFACGADYGQHADDELLSFAMIETLEGYRHIDEIAAVPGLSGIYIGPADLTLGLTGRKYPTGFDREEPEMLEAIRHLLDRAHAAGIKAGIHNGTPAYAARMIEWGFDFVTLSNDVRLLAGAAAASVKGLREKLGAAAAAEPAARGY